MAYLSLAELSRQYASMDLGYYLGLSEDVNIADFIKFKVIPGGRVDYKRYDVIPASTFHEINETPSALSAKPVSKELSLSYLSYCFDISYNQAAQAVGGEAAELADQRQLAGRSMAKTFNKYFFDGDKKVTPAQFDGVKALAVSEGAEVSQGTDVLSLAKLNEALWLAKKACGDRRDKTLILANSTHVDKMTALLQAMNIQMQYWDDAGKPALIYDGFKVKVIFDDATGSAILPFTETSSTSSLYIVTFAQDASDNGLFGVTSGIKENPPAVAKDGKSYMVDWGVALGMTHKYSVVRLKLITAS